MPHIHKLIDFVITAVIVHDDKVLLVHHPRYQRWLTPGGHIELDEDPEQALYREIAEETGLEVEIMSQKPVDLTSEHKFLLRPNLLDIHHANPPHRHIGLVYFARSKTADFVKSDEHEDMRWFNTIELHAPKYGISKEVIFYAEAALELAKSY